MPSVSLSVDWHGGLRFRNSDGSPAIELDSSAPGITSPPQALAYAVMVCMAMDVVHILEKSRADLRAFSVAFEGERAEEHPRRFMSMTLDFRITGNAEPHVVERAIELSRAKYCSVWNTIREDVELKTSYSIHP
ncbi:MAG TPA: OsmC family protein [Vicinamibacterales bacterium]|nr:OsmC family protein [Vicinamibacterales bacterium]